jgi:hypothetical protein
MTTQTKTPLNASFDEAAEKVQLYNEKILESSKKLTGSAVDSYEKAAVGVADFHEKVGGASNIDWIATVASAQAGLTRELTKAYAAATRDLTN